MVIFFLYIHIFFKYKKTHFIEIKHSFALFINILLECINKKNVKQICCWNSKVICRFLIWRIKIPIRDFVLRISWENYFEILQRNGKLYWFLFSNLQSKVEQKLPNFYLQNSEQKDCYETAALCAVINLMPL